MKKVKEIMKRLEEEMKTVEAIYNSKYDPNNEDPPTLSAFHQKFHIEKESMDFMLEELLALLSKIVHSNNYKKSLNANADLLKFIGTEFFKFNDSVEKLQETIISETEKTMDEAEEGTKWWKLKDMISDTEKILNNEPL